LKRKPQLADAEVDVIVFAATAPTARQGQGYDRELIKADGGCLGPAAHRGGNRLRRCAQPARRSKIAIGAPWSKIMDKPMVEFMDGAASSRSTAKWWASSPRSGSAGSARRCYELAHRIDRTGGGSDRQCRRQLGLNAGDRAVENELDKPILVNNEVSLWAGLRLLQRKRQHLGYGGCCATTSPRELA